MRHTAGPWHAMPPLAHSRDDHGYRLVADVRGLKIYAEAKNMIQEGKGFVWADKTQDARILAAAPDLLAALEDLVYQVSRLPKAPISLTKAKNAIARADASPSPL